jgi:uncharacterized protein YjbJ (UPF0337 family)
MNSKVLRSKWKQIKSKAQKQWGVIMYADFDLIANQDEKQKQLGKFHKHYGYSAAAMEKDYKEWYSRD